MDKKIWRMPEYMFSENSRQYKNRKELITDNYHYYYDIVKRLKAKSFLEIGVYHGLSAYAMLSAFPQAFYTGIDPTITPEAKKLFDLFPGANIDLVEAESSKLQIKNAWDLCHIDGDHSYEQKLIDLYIGYHHSSAILVHDYDNIPAVKKATNWFAEDMDLKLTHIPSFRGLALLEKR